MPDACQRGLHLTRRVLLYRSTTLFRGASLSSSHREVQSHVALVVSTGLDSVFFAKGLPALRTRQRGSSRILLEAIEGSMTCRLRVSGIEFINDEDPDQVMTK